MFGRRYLGVSVDSWGVRAVSLKRRRDGWRADWAVHACQGIRPLPDQPMLESPDAFAAALRSTLPSLAGMEDRIGLSLPDQCGRTLFIRPPAVPASGEEEREMVRWKVQEALNCDSSCMRLAYSRTTDNADGTCRYAVNVLQGNIFAQLDEVFRQEGFQIDFSGFETFNLWQQARFENRVEGKHVLLVSGKDRLNLLAAADDLPTASRMIPAAKGAEPVSEIARTLADWKRRKLVDDQTPFFLMTQENDEAEWSETLAGVLGRQARPLLSKETVTWGSCPPQKKSEMAAALAAARLLGGGKW